MIEIFFESERDGGWFGIFLSYESGQRSNLNSLGDLPYLMFTLFLQNSSIPSDP
jgi:hypothetical protein